MRNTGKHRGEGPAAAIVATLARLHPLARVPRAGWLLRGVAEPESVASHCHAVALLTQLVCDAWPDSFDAARAVAMALVHDCAEVVTMDIPMPAGDAAFREAKSRTELAAFASLFAGSSVRAPELFAEFERAETPGGAPRARPGQGADDDPRDLLRARGPRQPRGLLGQRAELRRLRHRGRAGAVHRGCAHCGPPSAFSNGSWSGRIVSTSRTAGVDRAMTVKTR